MDFIDSSPILAGLNYSKGQLLYRLGLRGHHSGSTAAAFSVDEAVSYIGRVVSDYLNYGATGDHRMIAGKRILEVGPGDNLGVAFRLLSLGAASVECLDAFEPVSNPGHNGLVYSALWHSMTDEERERVEDIVRVELDHSIALRTGDRLKIHYRAPIGTTEHLRLDYYDLVISRAVLEHVDDVVAGWRRLRESLRRDGEMWHEVDFRSHKMFDRIHPLYFLTWNERLWKIISSPDPTLNRCRLPVYRELLSKSFLASKVYVTRILNGSTLDPFVELPITRHHYSAQDLDDVRRIRPQLRPPFDSYSDEDLLISGVFLVGRKKIQ
jgi:hypothetical protein